ncbi:MAG: DUF3772 domain-containing protein, partial [Sphingobium sp.]
MTMFMLVRYFLLFLGLLLGGMSAAAYAQATDIVVESAKALDSAASTVRQIDAAMDENSQPEDRSALRTKLESARTSATQVVQVLQGQLDLVDARIAELGPTTDGVVEAPDIRAQRRLLAQQRSTIDSAIKRGKLLGIEAQQLTDEMEAAQAERLSKEIAARVSSPLSPAYWAKVVKAVPQDVVRIHRFITAERVALYAGIRQGALPWILAGVIAALLLIFPARRWLTQTARRFMIDEAPGRRVRRSGYALWRIAIGTAVPGFAVVIVVQVLDGWAMIAKSWTPVADTLVLSTFVGGFMASLGGALLMRGQSSWRLLPLSDATAEKLRPWTYVLALMVPAIALLDALNEGIGASTAARTAAEMAKALLHVAVLGGVLHAIGRIRAQREASTEGGIGPAHPIVAFINLALWVIVFLSLGAFLIGFVELSLFLTRMTIWTCVVISGLYVLLVATEDIATTVLCGESKVGMFLHQRMGVRASAIDQTGVLLSAMLRMLLVAVALGMLLAPFGAGVGLLFTRLGTIAQGVQIGEVTLSPGAILRAIAVFGIGFALVRFFQHWLTRRYLPVTELDNSARNSVSLVARYAGILLVALWGLASLGIGVERIALLLSALSVGIGFGLQA